MFKWGEKYGCEALKKSSNSDPKRLKFTQNQPPSVDRIVWKAVQNRTKITPRIDLGSRSSDWWAQDHQKIEFLIGLGDFNGFSGPVKIRLGSKSGPGNSIRSLFCTLNQSGGTKKWFWNGSKKEHRFWVEIRAEIELARGAKTLFLYLFYYFIMISIVF